jgi:ABC-2 type transport system permease protein
MRALDLAAKDLNELVRDWKSALFLVALPVVFTLMFGFAFGGFGGGESDPRIPIGILDQDGGQISARLLEGFQASTVVRPVVVKQRDADRLDKQVRDAEMAAAVIIPAGYGKALVEGALLRLAVIAGADSAGQTAASEIQLAVTRLAGSIEAARLVAQAIEDQAGRSPGATGGLADEASRQQFLTEATDRALAAWQEPPLGVEVRQSGADTEEEPSIMQSGFSHTSPSMMVQFAIAGLIGSASILVQERKTRSLRRLLTTPIARAEIVLGHYLAMVVLILAQLVILVAFGQLVLRVPYLRVPLATLLVMVTTALWTAALGLLIGTLARTDDQVILFSLIPMFVLAGMGGAWVPLEFTGKTFQAIGHVLPTAWAMDGFENIVIRGLGLDSVLVPAGVMLAYAVVLFGLAAWRFRFE